MKTRRCEPPVNWHHPISENDISSLRKILSIFGHKRRIEGLEVGCGTSTDILLSLCNLTILEIDEDKALDHAKKKNVTMVVGASEDYKTDKKFDLIFIDGDHRYEGISQDVKNLHAMLNSGGIICGHDYEKSEYDPDLIYNDAVDGVHHGVIKAVNDEFPDGINMCGTCIWWHGK